MPYRSPPHWPIFALCLLATIMPSAGYNSLHAIQAPASLENIALGKLCAFNRQANYQGAHDPGDPRQLTDGQFTKGHFWTQKSTVGWQGVQPVLITIDLGRVEPICGAALSTAAGQADILWPEVVMVMVSDDGRQWNLAGDLKTLSARHGRPPEEGYARHVYRSEELKTYGRYVMVGVLTEGNHIFTDEIEVFRGAPELLESGRGPTLDDPGAFLQRAKVTGQICKQLRADLHQVRASIQSNDGPQTARAKWLEEARRLSRRVDRLPVVERPGFKAILPMNDLERDIFNLRASVWRGQGQPTMRLWKNHRWEMLGPTEEPPAGANVPKLHIDLLNGEHRADVLNITSAAKEDLQIQVRIEGLPGGADPDYVSPYEVLCIGTRHLGAISSPLLPLKRQAGSNVLTLAPGMTRQLWFDFHPTDLPPGRHRGRIVLETAAGGKRNVPVELVVWPWKFPERTHLLLDGFTYTNGKGDRGINAMNRDAVIAFLRDHHVNVTWASQAALPEGKYDPQGRLIESPETADFDAWVRRWPDAQRYMVFLAVGGGYTGVDRPAFGGSKPGTELFEKKIAAWAHFWVDHIRSLGLRPDQFGLNIFDEPINKDQYDLLATWAKAIEQAEPELVTWVDPNPKTEDGTYLPMMAEVDELLPYRLLWYRYIDWYPELFDKQRQAGRRLGFYSCHQPARSFDPYSYYLLQAWHSFQIGGTSSAFWSFSDTRGANPWNNYADYFPGSYCPFILQDMDILSDKRMEAVRESAQDYEYLVMLRDRVEALEATGSTNQALTPARSILARACHRVLSGFQGMSFRWDQPLDRTVADKVRVDILKALASLDSFDNKSYRVK